jgi:tRNA(adenine34) deaminase
MELAFIQAKLAMQMGEVPVGAVLIEGGRVVASAHNMPVTTCDPSAHAEVLTLRQAAKRLGNYRMPTCTLYVTLEPCLMCAGAILHARLARLVFAAADPKTGVAGSVFNVFTTTLNHQTQVTGGLMAKESSTLLKRFFCDRRKK